VASVVTVRLLSNLRTLFQPAARCHANVRQQNNNMGRRKVTVYAKPLTFCYLTITETHAGSKRHDDIECIAALRAARHWHFHAKPTPENTIIIY